MDVKQAQKRYDEIAAGHDKARAEAVAQVDAVWLPRLAAARDKLKDAHSAARDLERKLQAWTSHDGGPCPVAADAMVLFRTTWEWAEIVAGGEPSISEGGGRAADTLTWEWTGNDMSDIAAYQVIDAARTPAKES